MKITIKTDLKDYVENLPKYSYLLHQDVPYLILDYPDEWTHIPIVDIQKKDITYILKSTLVTPVDVEFTFIPYRGDEHL